MARADYPSVEYVRQALEYRDGKLFWKVRPREQFATEKGWKIFNARDAGKEAGTLRPCKVGGDRWFVILNGIPIQRYRLVWAIHHGEWCPHEIDHKDRDQLNDQIDNLRTTTRSQNIANTRKSSRNTSGYKGVSRQWWRTRWKWKACIRVNGRLKCLGYFDDPEEAHEAYKKAAEQYFGEFAHDGS